MNLQRVCWRQSLWQLPPSCRRSISQAAARSTEQHEPQGQFAVPLLWTPQRFEYTVQHGLHDAEDPSNNLRRLYSVTGFRTAYTLYQSKIIRGLNARIAERGFEGVIKDIVIQTARNPQEAAVFNHASMAWNNFFYFGCIAEQPNRPMDPRLEEALIKDFGSIDNLRAEMLAMANAMFGPGFVWLVRVANSSRDSGMEFKLLPTYLAGSPFKGAHNRRQPIDMNTQNVASAQAAGGVEGLSRSQYSEQHMVPQNSVSSFGPLSRKTASEQIAYGGVDVTPCLAVSTWEHTYMHDWKFDKDKFLERWWTFIDWNVVFRWSGLEDARPRGRRQANMFQRA